MDKMFRVEILNAQGEITNTVIENEVNAIIHCGDFPKEWKDKGWTIRRTEISSDAKMYIKVYQIDNKKDPDRFKFMSYEFTKKKGGVKPELYRTVYAGGVTVSDLEELYADLNGERRTLTEPSEYRGHSLSMSDVVEVIRKTGSQFHYVDRIGFKTIEFDPSKCMHTKHLTKEDIEKALERQRDGAFRCPRCGRETMKPKLHTNALSRRADVYICDECGMSEAIEDIPGNFKTPFEFWAIGRTLID